MSLDRLKETLRPCSFSASSRTSSASPPPAPEPAPAILRKPPKSSVSQQLLRIDPGAALPSRPPLPPPPALKADSSKVGSGGEDAESEDEELTLLSQRRLRRCVRPSAPSLPSAFETPGQYEPLVLSASGEQSVVQVPASINCRLLKHQRDGVKFLYNLYRNNHGGVLGDDMGLGKTIQTIAFLAAIIGKESESTGHFDKERKAGPVLILSPTSVIRNWEREFSEWGAFSVAVYHGPNRELVLEKIESQGLEVLITSFDTFRIHDKTLGNIAWDVVVVDEAHRLKNEKSKLYQACLGLTTRKRFGLTGTIMQNKILELFNVFDWVTPGCLGDREHFRMFYDEPLKQGQRLSAPERFIQVADERKKHLVSVLKKYLLRRTKEETIGHLMLGKEDNIVFCKMSDLQKRVYRKMLEQPDVQILINKDAPCTCGSPLTQVECCKKIEPNGVIWSYLHKDNPDGCPLCPFCLVLPCLVKLQQISNHLELIKPNPKDEIEKQRKDSEFAAAVFGSDAELVGGNTKNDSFMGLSDSEHCGKMRALERLLSLWTSQGDKILLFSCSVRMLDILEKFLIRNGYCFSRFDGSTPMNARQLLVDEFNKSPSKQVFLISTRAGNLGVNLVSANRVVIFDPSWNPAQDLQAQDRSFRYGQKRHVTVFRLLAAGSLEELVYSRQIYKQQLANIAVSGKIEKRYFEGVQDNKKFQGELFGICNLFRDLSEKLFTSEIIEMHEEQGNVNIRQLAEFNDEVGSSKSGAQHKVRLCDDELDSQNEPKMDDLGIVYTHRNEDIVNLGKHTAEEDHSLPITSDGESAGVMPVIKHLKAQNLVSVTHSSSQTHQPSRHGTVATEKRKRDEFRRVASHLGMGELEFSKWVLSASLAEHLQVLESYKDAKAGNVAQKTEM